MRNLTITAEEEVIRWAKVWAAQHEMSLSRMVGQMLRDRMEREHEYETARREFLATEPVLLSETGQYPSREEVHDRRGLR